MLLFWVCGSGVPHRSFCVIIRMWPGSAPLEMLWGTCIFSPIQFLGRIQILGSLQDGGSYILAVIRVWSQLPETAYTVERVFLLQPQSLPDFLGRSSAFLWGVSPAFPCSLLSWIPPWLLHPILKSITLDSSGLPHLRIPNVNDDAPPLAAKPLAVDAVPCIGNVMCSVWGRSYCSIYLIVALCPESCLILDLLKYETGWCWGHSALESNFIRN